MYDDKNIRNPKHKDAGRGLLLLHAIPAFAFIYTAPYSCHYHCLCLQIYCILFLQLWYTVISIHPSSISLPSSSLKSPFCSLPSHESTCAKKLTEEMVLDYICDIWLYYCKKYVVALISMQVWLPIYKLHHILLGLIA